MAIHQNQKRPYSIVWPILLASAKWAKHTSKAVSFFVFEKILAGGWRKPPTVENGGRPAVGQSERCDIFAKYRKKY